MKLEFESVSELKEFLSFLDGIAYRPQLADATGGVQPCTLVPGVNALAPSAGDAATDQAARDLPIGPYETKVYSDGTTVTGTGPLPELSPAQQAAEPAKRKRRTKAEIESDEAAAAAAKTAHAAGGSTDVARTVHADGTVTTRSVGLPPDVDPNEVTAAPQGANPFEQAASTEAETPKTEEPAADADTVVTPFQHLTRAREFIAKHGMPKYNESFAKAGLDPNVMGYTAYQRGLHMEALTALERA